MHIDPWIFTFSALTVIATICMGFWSAKRSKTASDFFVAGRSVSVGWNASAISGEYLSAASFMGVAGMVMSSGYDALWYPVCYACGYLFLLLFIAGPLRRFGAYTIPDFAEGRFDSPLFRKIAVVFVLFIGFFYTMPQMKGAGTTLAYIFPGLPYWAGVVLVGAVITLNVALGGMKGITLVQAFQYWLKMFAISVPIFVLMAVYGHYGKQVDLNGTDRLGGYTERSQLVREIRRVRSFDGFDEVHGDFDGNPFNITNVAIRGRPQDIVAKLRHHARLLIGSKVSDYSRTNGTLGQLLGAIASHTGRIVLVDSDIRSESIGVSFDTRAASTRNEALQILYETARKLGFAVFTLNRKESVCVDRKTFDLLASETSTTEPTTAHELLPAVVATRAVFAEFSPEAGSPSVAETGSRTVSYAIARARFADCVRTYAGVLGKSVLAPAASAGKELTLTVTNFAGNRDAHAAFLQAQFENNGFRALAFNAPFDLIVPTEAGDELKRFVGDHALGARFKLEPAGAGQFRLGLPGIDGSRRRLPTNAPTDTTWLNPFGPLTTKAAKTAAATPIRNHPPAIARLKSGVNVDFVTVFQGPPELNRMKGKVKEAWHQKVTKDWGTGTGAAFGSETNSVHQALYAYAQDHWCTVLRAADLPDTTIRVPTNAYPQGKFGDMIEQVLATNDVVLLHEEEYLVKAVPAAMVETRTKTTVLSADQIRPYALLYTYSLIIALVCGTAGLPHILVRFYTNPDGVAAKRTTMWVMILIGVFYLFPPVFGVMGRNLLPDLYAGAGAKGTDKVVLELPRILNEKGSRRAGEKGSRGEKERAADVSSAPLPLSTSETGGDRSKIPWGSILSGITCAGAFAAFMSTFSGLLVSLTGALAGFPGGAVRDQQDGRLGLCHRGDELFPAVVSQHLVARHHDEGRGHRHVGRRHLQPGYHRQHHVRRPGRVGQRPGRLLCRPSTRAHPGGATRHLGAPSGHRAHDFRVKIDRRRSALRHPHENACPPRPGEARPQAGIHPGTPTGTLNR